MFRLFFSKGIFHRIVVYTFYVIAYRLHSRTKSWNYNLNHEYGFNVWGYTLGWFNIFHWLYILVRFNIFIGYIY